MLFKKKCPSCGSKNPKDAITCASCGTPFELRQLERPETIRDYDEAIRLSPQSAEAYYKRGFAYQKLGQGEQAIEDFDARVVAPILKGLENLGECRVLMAPDHRTPIALRTHSREPVPFVLWGTGVEPDGLQAYGERPAAAGSMQVDHGHLLMQYLIGKK